MTVALQVLAPFVSVAAGILFGFRVVGHVPIIHPGLITLEGQIAPLERAVARRRSRLFWRRRAASRALPRLIVLRQHLLYGEHNVVHGGSCPRGSGVCGIKAPPKPIKAAEPTYRRV